MSELVKAAQRVVDAILGPWIPGRTPISAISEIREATHELRDALRETDSSRTERDALQEAHDRLCAELAEAKAKIAKLHHQHTQALALLTEHHADRIRDLGLADAVTRKEFDECHAALRDTEKERDEVAKCYATLLKHSTQQASHLSSLRAKVEGMERHDIRMYAPDDVRIVLSPDGDYLPRSEVLALLEKEPA